MTDRAGGSGLWMERPRRGALTVPTAMLDPVVSSV
jgi:hypothetical protein